MTYFLKYLPKLAYALSGESHIRALALYISLTYFSISRKMSRHLQDVEYSINGTYKGSKITYYLNKSIDVASLIEIFVFKEYEWDCGFVPQTILDLGAHYGDTALYYNAVYPNATIIAVEPEPTNFARLKKNVAKYKNIIPVNCALGSQNGLATLYLAKNSLGHSTTIRKGSVESVEIPEMALSQILADSSIKKVDLLKFDIEGAERHLFDDPDLLAKSRSFIGELHFDLNNDLKVENVVETLEGLDIKILPTLAKERFTLKAV